MTRRRTGRVRESRGGFTLIETLVAILLMGLVMSALATVTAQWLPNWNRGLLRVQRNEQVAIALDRLAADLSSALYVSARAESDWPLFEGDELGVVFIRRAIGPNAGPGLEIVRVAEAADGRALVRTRAPFVPFANGELSIDSIPFADPVVLLRAPLRLTFAYRLDGAWRSRWHDRVLPTAVRLVVRDGTERALAVSTATPIHVGMAAPQPEQAN